MVKKPRLASTTKDVARFNLYMRDNPNCALKDAALVLGLRPGTVRMWKSRGYVEHETKAKARQAEAPRLIEATAQQQPAQPARSHRKTLAGVVAPQKAPPAVEFETLDRLIERGKTLKISEIRALVKANLVAQVHDAKAVSNFAAGLRALSGVQDVELEDIYESEQMIKVYVPVEDTMPNSVPEVDKIEY